MSFENAAPLRASVGLSEISALLEAAKDTYTVAWMCRSFKVPGSLSYACALSTGVRHRASMHRAAQPEPTGGDGFDRPEPVIKLSEAGRDQRSAVLHSDRFVDQTPDQIYAQLLAEGHYPCSVSTMYRVLNDHQQIKERRRQARHPARKVPELVAHSPDEVVSWDNTKLASPTKGTY